MATLKLKHLVLYFMTFILLYYADIPGGALLSIAAWLQLCVLLWKKDYTSKNQLLVFMYFLTLIPLLIFLGSSGSFISIYMKNGSILFMLMASALTFALCWLTVVSCVLGVNYFNEKNTIMTIYQKAFLDVKKNLRLVLGASFFLLILIILPLWLRQDFKISLAVILIHLYLNRNQLQSLTS